MSLTLTPAEVLSVVKVLSAMSAVSHRLSACSIAPLHTHTQHVLEYVPISVAADCGPISVSVECVGGMAVEYVPLNVSVECVSVECVPSNVGK